MEGDIVEVIDVALIDDKVEDTTEIFKSTDEKFVK